jgi:hypothetical protein
LPAPLLLNLRSWRPEGLVGAEPAAAARFQPCRNPFAFRQDTVSQAASSYAVVAQPILAVLLRHSSIDEAHAKSDHPIRNRKRLGFNRDVKSASR